MLENTINENQNVSSLLVSQRAWGRPIITRSYQNLLERSPNSEGGYGINTQVEKSKKMTTVNFMGYDLNKLF